MKVYFVFYFKCGFLWKCCIWFECGFLWKCYVFMKLWKCYVWFERGFLAPLVCNFHLLLKGKGGLVESVAFGLRNWQPVDGSLLLSFLLCTQKLFQRLETNKFWSTSWKFWVFIRILYQAVYIYHCMHWGNTGPPPLPSPPASMLLRHFWHPPPPQLQFQLVLSRWPQQPPLLLPPPPPKKKNPPPPPRPFHTSQYHHAFRV